MSGSLEIKRPEIFTECENCEYVEKAIQECKKRLNDEIADKKDVLKEIIVYCWKVDHFSRKNPCMFSEYLYEFEEGKGGFELVGKKRVPCPKFSKESRPR